MSVQIDGSKAKEQLREYANNIQSVAIEILDSLATVMQTNAKSTRLFKTHSPNGGLRANIIIEKTRTLERRVKANKHYGGWVENGNDPGGGYIYPVKAKKLRFVLNGEVVFRSRVKAAKPRPFMKQAFELTERVASTFVNSRMSRFIDSGK